ncbi:hypothetical protein [Nocardia sp. Marseille-Q1738]
MDAPHSQHVLGPGRDTRYRPRWHVVLRIVAGVISIATGALWLWCVFLVLSSRLSTDPANDPHGYGLIIGTMLAVPSGLVAALALPFAFPREHRTRAIRISMPAFAVTSVLLLTALFTA